MQDAPHELAHVSDTALMTAACRAMETERADGLIRDPFAAQLAGARGMAVTLGLERYEMMCFGVAIRTCFLDRLVLETIPAHGIATVLSIGAGLDTRPWRLDLPASLRWIEVDFPPMLDYKDSIMAATAPKCRRPGLAADVNQASGRESVFSAAEGPTLMITEGLLMYLSGATIDALAANTAASHWLLDVTSPEMARRVKMNTYQTIENLRAEGHLDGLQTLETLYRRGWVGLRRLGYSSDALAVAADRIYNMFRHLPPDQMPEPLPPNDPSGVNLFGRASA